MIRFLNFFFSIYVIILLFIFGYLEIASESFVVIALTTIFSQGLSANIRNIYLGSDTVINLKPLILTRILWIFTSTWQESTAICKIAYKFFLNCSRNSWIIWDTSSCTSSSRSILTDSTSLELNITLIKSWFMMRWIREISLWILFRGRLII